MEEEEEEEEEEERGGRGGPRFVDNFYDDVQHQCTENDHDIVADIIRGGKSLLFLPKKATSYDRIMINHQTNVSEELFLTPNESITTEDHDHESSSSSSPPSQDSECDYEVTDSLPNSVNNIDSSWSTTPITIELRKSATNNLESNSDKSCDEFHDIGDKNVDERDENFLIFSPAEMEMEKKKKKLNQEGKEKEVMRDIEEEVYGDSCTVGSTSKSSSEWRSSINCRDSGTEDPFSSSSRRRCPK